MTLVMITAPQTLSWLLLYYYLGRPVPEETFAHSHPSWSLNILRQLPPSTTIHSLLLARLTCLTVLFHNLSPGPLWSTAETLYFTLQTFLHPIIIFYATHAHTVVATCFAAVPRLCHLFLISFSARYLESIQNVDKCNIYTRGSRLDCLLHSQQQIQPKINNFCWEQTTRVVNQKGMQQKIVLACNFSLTDHCKMNKT